MVPLAGSAVSPPAVSSPARRTLMRPFGPSNHAPAQAQRRGYDGQGQSLAGASQALLRRAKSCGHKLQDVILWRLTIQNVWQVGDHLTQNISIQCSKPVMQIPGCIIMADITAFVARTGPVSSPSSMSMALIPWSDHPAIAAGSGPRASVAGGCMAAMHHIAAGPARRAAITDHKQQR